MTWGGEAWRVRALRAWSGAVVALGLTIVVVLVVPSRAVATGSQPAAQTAGAPDLEAGFVRRVAAERDAGSRSGLSVRADLTAVARQHAAAMAAASRPYHNPLLAEQVRDWQVVGENVGVGPTVEDVHAALMASSKHRDVLLNASFTEIGVGVVEWGGALWVTQVFRRPLPGARLPAPPPPPPASTEPGGPAPAPLLSVMVAPRVKRTTMSSTVPATTTTAAATVPPPPAPPAPAPAPPAPAPAPAPLLQPEDLSERPFVVSASRPLPVPTDLPDAGLLAATLLWAVVAGFTRVTIQLRPLAK